MKFVKDLLSKEEINAAISKNISTSIEKSVSDVFPKLPNSYFYMMKWYYWFFLIISSILIIPVLLHIFQRNKQRKIIFYEMDQSKIFGEAMNSIKEMDFVSIQQNKNVRNLYNYRINSIPSDARITKASDLLSFKILGKYFAEARTGNAYWTRQYGRYRAAYNVLTGYILIDVQKVWPTYNFVLSQGHLWKKNKIILESEDFNKEFTFQANDRVKARMQFSPLAMEKMIAQKKLIRSSWWEVIKMGSALIIKFKPKSWDELAINLSFKKVTVNGLTQEIINSVTDDLYTLYTLLGLVLIPIML